MLFHLPGRRTVNLLCALLIQGKETSYAHQTAASSLLSLFSPLENWFSMHPTPDYPNLQIWNHTVYVCVLHKHVHNMSSFRAVARVAQLVPNQSRFVYFLLTTNCFFSSHCLGHSSYYNTKSSRNGHSEEISQSVV